MNHFHINGGNCNLPSPRAGENQTTTHLLPAKALMKQWDQWVQSPLAGSRGCTVTWNLSLHEQAKSDRPVISVLQSFFFFNVLRNSMMTWTKQKSKRNPNRKEGRIHLPQQVSQNAKLFSDHTPVTYTDSHTFGICGKTLLILFWQTNETTQFDWEKKKTQRSSNVLAASCSENHKLIFPVHVGVSLIPTHRTGTRFPTLGSI